MIKTILKNNELASLIVKNGDTQVSFSDKIGITATGLRKILNKEINPSPITAKKICDILECKFDDIFTIG